MPGVYLFILSVLENFERRFITCFWFVGSCLHFFSFIYLFIIPPEEEFCPAVVPLSPDVLHPESCPADIQPSPDISHPKPLSGRYSTLSGCLTSGILSAIIPPSSDVSHPEFYPANIPPSPDVSYPEFCPSDVQPSPDISRPAPDAWLREGGDSTSPVRHIRILVL